MARQSPLRRLGAALLAGAAAIAVTVTLPVFAAPAAAAGIGRATNFAFTGYTSDNKGVRVDCPAGKTLIGTAASLGGGEGQVRIDQVTPYEDHMYVHAVEDEDGYAYTWSVGGTVICADKPSGWQIVQNTSATTSGPSNSVNADCPTTQNLTGMGFAISTLSGEVGIDDLNATSSTRATGTAYEDRTGFSGTWNLKVYAICTDQLADYEIVGAGGLDQSSTSAIQTANCSISGNKIIGGGGHITGGLGKVVVDDFSETPTSYSIKAYEDQAGLSTDWHLHAYAICAKP